MSRTHRSRSTRHVVPQDYSGAPFFDTALPNGNLSGFESFAELGHPSMFVGTPELSTQDHHTPFEQAHIGTPCHSDYLGSYFAHPSAVVTAQVPSYPSQGHDAYWQSHAQNQGNTTPLPSPPLLAANSLNLPPIFPAGQDHSRYNPTFALTDPLYNPPPDIPYAESAESAASSTLSPEDEDHPIGDEKRRRNLAASARFRQKKKLREQQLDKAARELGDRVGELEGKIEKLEQENKFLKALLTEKETDMTEVEKRRFREFASMMEQGGM